MPKAIRLIFILTRAAKKSGEDRYECIIASQEKPFILYVPQFISRLAVTATSKVVAEEIDVTFEAK